MIHVATTETTYVFEDQGRKIVYPRATTILETFFPAQWTEEARWRGSCVHKGTSILDGVEPGRTLDWSTVAEELLPYFQAWEKMKVDLQPVILQNERLVVHPHRQYAGRLDRVLLLSLKSRVVPALVDQKTGVPHVRHQLQTALYKGALKLNPGFTTPPVEALKRLAIYLRSNGTYHLEWHEDRADEAAAMAYAQAYHWQRRYLKERV